MEAGNFQYGVFVSNICSMEKVLVNVVVYCHWLINAFTNSACNDA
jgi:hypothetical protein